jgi:hypothetical protein
MRFSFCRPVFGWAVSFLGSGPDAAGFSVLGATFFSGVCFFFGTGFGGGGFFFFSAGLAGSEISSFVVFSTS